jgi:PRTRC genetic system protein B
MNIYVDIGSSEDFKLARALLIYGKNNYDSIPYRHPFVTLHEVFHDNSGARLGEGQLATPRVLTELVTQLGKPLPIEILPERVLVRVPEMIVWWTPAILRPMFFSDRGSDQAVNDLNAKNFPHPALVFKAHGTRLWVRALSENKRPEPNARLFTAPYWNCYDDGNICTGSMRIPRARSIDAIDSWEQSFFQSEFTHALGNQKPTRFPGGLLALWKALAGKKRFPVRYLAPAPQTLESFVTTNDQKLPHRRPLE